MIPGAETTLDIFLLPFKCKCRRMVNIVIVQPVAMTKNNKTTNIFSNTTNSLERNDNDDVVPGTNLSNTGGNTSEFTFVVAASLPLLEGVGADVDDDDNDTASFGMICKPSSVDDADENDAEDEDV